MNPARSPVTTGPESPGDRADHTVPALPRARSDPNNGLKKRPDDEPELPWQRRHLRIETGQPASATQRSHCSPRGQRRNRRMIVVEPVQRGKLRTPEPAVPPRSEAGELQERDEVRELHVSGRRQLVAAADRGVQERSLLTGGPGGDARPEPRPRDLVPDDPARHVDAQAARGERVEVERPPAVEADANDQ